jgi:DNA topoisomerase III
MWASIPDIEVICTFGGKMVFVLNVAEKPSVAKEISFILGEGHVQRVIPLFWTLTPRQRLGLSEYNPVFEFDYTLEGQRSSFIVTSVTGHITEIDFTEEHRKWSSCDPLALFDAPIRKQVSQVNPSLPY